MPKQYARQVVYYPLSGQSILMSQTNHKTQVGIYARVSTKDKQDVENQLRELQRWVKSKGYKVYKEYIDNKSGGTGRAERKRFSQMLEDAHQKKCDLVFFWTLDPFSRKGPRKTIHYLQHPEELEKKRAKARQSILALHNNDELARRLVSFYSGLRPAVA